MFNGIANEAMVIDGTRFVCFSIMMHPKLLNRLKCKSKGENSGSSLACSTLRGVEGHAGALGWGLR